MSKVYLEIVAKTIQDIVPKHIVYLLIENVSYSHERVDVQKRCGHVVPTVMHRKIVIVKYG